MKNNTVRGKTYGKTTENQQNFSIVTANIMGCGSSSSQYENMTPEITPDLSDNKIRRIRGETIIEAYQRLDQEICALEKTCPGPRLATAEAWIDHLEGKAHSLFTILESDATIEVEEILVEEDDPRSRAIKDVSTTDAQADIVNIAVRLGVTFDVAKAAQNEEFLANLSRDALETTGMKFYSDLIEHAKARRIALMTSYENLSALYVEQDGLIASFNGGVYITTLEEQLDSQLEQAREIRDKLGSVMEQWRTSASMLKASAKSAMKAYEVWSIVKKSKIDKECLTYGTECRYALQASLIAFECAQMSLPQVDIKFVSKRQTLAISHANVYLLTDIAADVRYTHTKKVLEAYQESLTKSVKWLYETFQKTLKRDFDDAEQVVSDIANKLRQERIRIITAEAGPRLYSQKDP